MAEPRTDNAAKKSTSVQMTKPARITELLLKTPPLCSPCLCVSILPVFVFGNTEAQRSQSLCGVRYGVFKGCVTA